MGLDHFIDSPNSGKDDLDTGKSQQNQPVQCPRCGAEGEETDYWYYRCPNDLDVCSTLTFMVVDS